MSSHTIQVSGSDGCIYIHDGDTKEICRLRGITKPVEPPVEKTLDFAGLDDKAVEL
jgi:hypothetical protein